ncbi:MAG: DUF2179 domain-containing protein [Candidatus Aminicenantes bacterium]|nr:DUF2179 domain-containing protein [Candidatus Aminicenantes bacterium]
METFINTELFKWVVLPLLIFSSRIFDVTLATIRIVFVSKRLKYLAPVVGFFEVIVWLLAINTIISNLNNVVGYIAYGLGFAAGTYIGICIEEKLALGNAVLRVITRMDASELVDHLRAKGYPVTKVIGEGKHGEVNIVFMVIRRCDYKEVVTTLRQFNPKAFFTLEDVRMVSKKAFPFGRVDKTNKYQGPFRFFRKGK